MYPFSPPHKRVISADLPPLPQHLRRPHLPHECTGAQALPPAITTAPEGWECRRGRGSSSTRPPAQALPSLQAMQPTCLRKASSSLVRDSLAVAGVLRKPKIPVSSVAEVGRGGGRRESGERKRLCRRAAEHGGGVGCYPRVRCATDKTSEVMYARGERITSSWHGNHFTSIPPDGPPSSFCWPIPALSMRSTHVHIIAAVREHMTEVMEVAVIEEGNGRPSTEGVLTRHRA
ncbi:hypothetical protein B0H13DRAFT_2065687 [Mycena leptocephala]|nr:hypothetical protein B0H13DRAFT_2065687 [Mycena leptocephala]